MSEKSSIQDFDAEIIKIDKELLALGSEVIELVFRFISEDIHAWIKGGGCLSCNGTGIAKPWGDKAHFQDSIICPHCDGRSERYSLSYAATNSAPTSAYFPEVDYALLDSARSLGLDGKYPVFWTEARLLSKHKLEDKIAKLKKKRHDVLYKKQDAIYKQSLVAAETAARPAAQSAGELPDLHGVSLRQINYGVVCRRAAIESGKVTQEEAAKITSAVHWIENYKNLVRR